MLAAQPVSSPLLRNLRLTVGLRNSLAVFQFELPLLQAFCLTGGIAVVLAGNTVKGKLLTGIK